MSDELAPNHIKKADQKNVVAKPYDVADAYVFEVQDGKDKGLLGEWEGKVGPHTLYCSPTYYGEYDLEAYQSIFELCRTLRFEEKK